MKAVAFGAAVLLLVSGPADAATTADTDAFVASVSRAYAVLLEADGVAQAGQGSARLRAFARRDQSREMRAASLLSEWEQATRIADQAAARTPSIDGLGPLFFPFDSTILPLDLHRQRAADADRATLAQLERLDGPSFDALFVATARVALERLAHDYDDYIKNGDDPALRRLSVAELPVVRMLLAELPAR